MKQRIWSASLACALVLAILMSGCMPRSRSRSMSSTPASLSSSESSSVSSVSSSEEEIPPEEMKNIKYNIYVQLGNKMIKILNKVDSYFLVVADEPEFRLLPDSGYTYGYDISGFNTDIVMDALSVAAMEPPLGNLDAYVTELGEPLLTVIDIMDQIDRDYDYAANQYAKPKERHKTFYEAVHKLDGVVDEFFAELGALGDEKEAQWREELKAEGSLIAYNGSQGIYLCKKLLRELAAEGVTDANLTEMDLTKIRPIYDELAETVAALDTALADNDQLMKESLPKGDPFSNRFHLMLDTIDYMFQRVQSGRGMEDPGMVALGTILHIQEVLSDCIEDYNRTFAGA